MSRYIDAKLMKKIGCGFFNDFFSFFIKDFDEKFIKPLPVEIYDKKTKKNIIYYIFESDKENLYVLDISMKKFEPGELDLYETIAVEAKKKYNKEIKTMVAFKNDIKNELIIINN